MRAYAARFVADDLVKQWLNRQLAVALCRMSADGLCSKCVHSNALCSAPSPVCLTKQFTSGSLPLNLAFPIGNRTLSQLRSLARCEPSTSISGGFRGFRLCLAVNITYVGALGGSIALGRSSPTRENGCACAALTRLTAMPSSHSRSQFIAHRVLLN